MKTVAVIGSGTMGNGIAQVFAQFGYKVNLIDVSETALKNGFETVSKNLDRMIAKEVITIIEKNNTLNKISLFTSFQEGVKDAFLAIEAATEKSEVKTAIFKELDACCDTNTILASNTSSISITQLGNATKRPDKVIGMHFMNPVPLMKLVEVIKGKQTSTEITKTIMELSVELNKIPVEVNDFPGFVANRILMPMINEAIEALHDGVSGVKEIDTVMKLGMAHPMGPLQLADFIGLDVCLSILNVMFDGFKNPKYAPCPLLVNMVNAGHLGVKSGEGFYDYSTTRKADIVAKQFK